MENTENSEQRAESTDEKIEEAIINDVIEKIPQEDRHEAKKMMSMTMQMGKIMSSSPELELMKKMTSQNIETFLEGQRVAMSYEFKEGRENKIFYALLY